MSTANGLESFVLQFEEIAPPKYMQRPKIKAVMISRLYYPKITTKQT